VDATTVVLMVGAVILLAFFFIAIILQKGFAIPLLILLPVLELTKKILYLANPYDPVRENAFILGVFQVVLVLLCLNSIIKPNFIAFSAKPVSIALIFWMVIGVASTFLGSNATFVAKVSGIAYVAIPAIAFLYIGSASDERLNVDSFVSVGVTIGILSSLYAVFQLFVGMTPLEVEYALRAEPFSIGARWISAHLAREDYWYCPSFFSSPGEFSQYILFAAGMVPAFLFDKAGLVKPAVVLTIALGGFCTGSRFTWLGLLVFAVAYSMFIRFGARPGVVMFTIAVAFVLSALLPEFLIRYAEFSHGFEDRFFRRATTTGTLADRTGQIPAASDALRKYPVLGKGYGVIDVLVGKFGEAEEVEENFSRHTWVVWSLVATGLLGTVCLVLFMYFFLVDMHSRFFLPNPRMQVLTASAGAYLFASVIMALGGNTFLNPYFWLGTGVFAYAVNREEASL